VNFDDTLDEAPNFFSTVNNFRISERQA
jgi:hypothetical protein